MSLHSPDRGRCVPSRRPRPPPSVQTRESTWCLGEGDVGVVLDPLLPPGPSRSDLPTKGSRVNLPRPTRLDWSIGVYFVHVRTDSDHHRVTVVVLSRISVTDAYVGRGAGLRCVRAPCKGLSGVGREGGCEGSGLCESPQSRTVFIKL